MDKIFLKYKNTIIFLVVLLIVLIGVRKFQIFYSARIDNRSDMIKEIKEKIELAGEIKAKDSQSSELRQSFIAPDSYAFINLISKYIQEAGLEIISLKPADVFTSWEDKDKVIERIILNLKAKGSFESLRDFLNALDKEKLNIVISNMRLAGEGKDIISNIDILGLSLKGR